MLDVGKVDSDKIKNNDCELDCVCYKQNHSAFKIVLSQRHQSRIYPVIPSSLNIFHSEVNAD